MLLETRVADTNLSTPDIIVTDLELPRFLIGDSLFDDSPVEYRLAFFEAGLNDDPPDSDILANTLAGDSYLPAPAPPAAAVAMAGVAFFAILEILRRIPGKLRRFRRQKTHRRRRRVRIYLRMMS
jgi:hypothetical protein